MIGEDTDSDAARDTERIAVEIEGRAEFGCNSLRYDRRVIVRTDWTEGDKNHLPPNLATVSSSPGTTPAILERWPRAVHHPSVPKTIINDLETVDVEV